MSQASKVRRWARDNGIDVGTRGHLPSSVIDQYNSQHRGRNRFADTNPHSKARLQAPREQVEA